MKTLSRFVPLIVVLSAVVAAAATAENFSGEWADKNFHGNSVFQLSLEQTGATVAVIFSANRKDGSGAAPEAEGKGKVSSGAVQFTWSDSFSNSGSGTIRKAGKEVTISIKATKVADPRCLMFYGENMRLKWAGKG